MGGTARVRAHLQRATLMVSVSQRPKALPLNGPDTRHRGTAVGSSVGPPHALLAALVHPPHVVSCLGKGVLGSGSVSPPPPLTCCSNTIWYTLQWTVRVRRLGADSLSSPLLDDTQRPPPERSGGGGKPCRRRVIGISRRAKASCGARLIARRRCSRRRPCYVHYVMIIYVRSQVSRAVGGAR